MPIDEFAAIARFFAPLSAAQPGAFGLTDDAAVLRPPPGRALVLTVDTLIAGVHFLLDDPVADLGAKALAVNLSDLAAMGAGPIGYLLALSLPSAWADGEREDWLQGFSGGLARAQEEFGVTLIGGDTVATPGPLSLTVTAVGSVPAERALKRSAARPGDEVYVSGTIGDAALGLAALQGRLPGLDEGEAACLIERYRRPQPRLALGPALIGIAHACADISDGLIADLGHICTASGVSATVEAARVPLSTAVRAVVKAAPEWLLTVLTGGDDYELVFTVSPAETSAIAALHRRLGIPLTAIGRILPAAPTRLSPPVSVVAVDGSPVATGAGGYRHY